MTAGEGDTWEDETRMRLSPDGNVLTLSSHQHEWTRYRVRRGRSPNQPMIGTRLRVMAERNRFGDYEIDTVIGRPVAGCYSNSSKLGSVEESAT